MLYHMLRSLQPPRKCLPGGRCVCPLCAAPALRPSQWRHVESRFWAVPYYGVCRTPNKIQDQIQFREFFIFFIFFPTPKRTATATALAFAPPRPPHSAPPIRLNPHSGPDIAKATRETSKKVHGSRKGVKRIIYRRFRK